MNKNKNFAKGDKSNNKSKTKPQRTGKGSKNMRRNEEVIDSILREEKSKRNDFSWYNHFPEYTNFAGTLAFGKPLGGTFNMATPASTAMSLQHVVPGIMTLRFIPTVGYSENRESAINRAAIRWYSALRRHQKASGNYDSQDMMMAYVAIDSAYIFYESVKRALGMSNLVDPLNRYAPEGFLKAAGFDPIDVRNNVEQYWGFINKFAIDMQTVCIPKDLDLRVRHEWMASGIYLDDQPIRSQAYMFVPEGIWIFDNTAKNGTELKWQQMAGEGSGTNGLLTIADVKEIGGLILSSLFGDQDIDEISGDTYNAIGPANVVSLQQVAREYTVVPSYSEVVLSQIENSTAFGTFQNTANAKISQNPSVNQGAIIFTPNLVAQGVPGAQDITHKKFINMHKDKPSVEDVIEATRLTSLIDKLPGTDGTFQPTSFPTEWVTQYDIWKADVNNTQSYSNRTFYSQITIPDPSTAAFLDNVCRIVCDLAAFDWHPSIAIFVQGEESYYYCGSLLDFATTAELSYEKLADMHEAAITSEMDMPQKFLS